MPGSLSATYKEAFASAGASFKRTRQRLEKLVDKEDVRKEMVKADKLKETATVNIKAFKSLYLNYYPKSQDEESENEADNEDQ